MNMKNLVVTTLALGAAVFAGNSNAAQTTAQANATVITPIAIDSTIDLEFGSFAPGAAGGTVTVSTNGVRTASGAFLSGGAAGTAAEFDVTGTAGLTYAITVSPTVSLTGDGTAMSMDTVSDLDATGATSNVGTGILDGTGAQTIFVGGTLTVGIAQLAGAYTGAISVDVEYN